MNERLKTHSKTQKKSADLVSNKLRIGVLQRYQMKCKSVSKKSPRYTPYSSIIGIPLVEPVIRRTLGIIRRKDAVLSPAAERFFALLINLWTDDKDNLWTNIVERQRHALQEIS